MLESIKNEYPPLAFYWNLIYSGPNRGLTRHGLEHHATQRVLQGDALATLFFRLGINSALISTSQHLLSTDFQLAFVDDITFSASADQLVLLFNSLQSNLASYGLSLNCSKSQLYPHSTTIPIPDNLRQLSIPIKSEGIVVLGTPIGTDEFITSFSTSKAQTTPTLLQAISPLNKQQQLLLARVCIQPRLHHLLRTIQPELLSSAINIHQDAIKIFLQHLLTTSSFI